MAVLLGRFGKVPCGRLFLRPPLFTLPQQLTNHGNGTFGKWCKERLGISKRSAYDHLNACECFGDKDCPSLGQSFTCEALYLLSRDSTPDDAITDALKAAKKGERTLLPLTFTAAAAESRASPFSLPVIFPEVFFFLPGAVFPCSLCRSFACAAWYAFTRPPPPPSAPQSPRPSPTESPAA